MHSTYILYSRSINRFYIGSTSDVQIRLERHNRGYEKYTRKGRPWLLVWSTANATRGEAYRLELKLKNLNHKRLIAFILKYEHDLRMEKDVFLVIWGSSQDDA